MVHSVKIALIKGDARVYALQENVCLFHSLSGSTSNSLLANRQLRLSHRITQQGTAGLAKVENRLHPAQDCGI